MNADRAAGEAGDPTAVPEPCEASRCDEAGRLDGTPVCARGAVAKTLIPPELRPFADTVAPDPLATVAPDHPTDPSETLVPEPLPEETEALLAHLVRREGRYRLVQLYAEGGLGKVWIARDGDLNRDVALKEIQPERAMSPEMCRRFIKEAQVTGQLEHPNIVPVYELARRIATDQPFYTMRFVRGHTLNQAITEYQARRSEQKLDPLERPKLLRAFVSVCQAIAYAHSRGVIHRDLKPENVVLGAFGEVIVLDWGLAKMVDHPDDPADFPDVELTDDARVEATSAGRQLGTPAYMAPEQAAGHLDLIDARTDIYGLGAILFEILTAQPPHNGRNIWDTLRRVCSEPTPVAVAVEPSVPPALSAVCAKAMRKDRNERYATATDLATDIELWLADEPVSVHRDPRWKRFTRWARRHKTLVASVSAASTVLTFALIIGAFIVIRLNAITAQKVSEDRTHQYASLLARVREDRDNPTAGWTWSAVDDLRRAAAINTAVRNPLELRTEAAAALSTVDVHLSAAIAKGFPAGCLAFSPDGRRLALGAAKAFAFFRCKLLLVDVATDRVVSEFVINTTPVWKSGEPLIGRMAQDGVRTLAFSPDGRWLFAGMRSGAIHAWDLTQVNAQPISWATHQEVVETLVCSARGHGLFSWSPGDRSVKRWDGKGAWKHAASAPLACLAFASQPSSASEHLFATAEDGRLVRLQPERLDPVPIEPGITAGLLALSPDGRFLAANGSEGIQIVDAERPRVLRTIRARDDDKPPHVGGVSSLAFSPDGSLLASIGEGDRKVKLWEAASGQLLSSLTEGGTGRIQCAFSPDGTIVAITGEDQVKLYEIGGRTTAKVIVQVADPIISAAWAPDGSALACISRQEAPLVDGYFATTFLWHPPAHQPRFWRADLSSLGGTFASSLAFHPTGYELAFATTTSGIRAWKLSDPQPSEPFMSERAACLAFSPDGTRLWGVIGDVDVASWSVPGYTPRSRWSNKLAMVMSGLSTIEAISAGSLWVLAGGRDSAARILQASNGQPVEGVTISEAGGDPIEAVALNPDERLAVAGTRGGTVCVFRVPTCDIVSRSTVHRDAVTSVAFRNDGRVLATASADRTIKLWRISTTGLEELVVFRSRSGPVDSISFNNDGSRLLMLVRGETALRVWYLDELDRRMASMGLDW